MKKKIIWLYRSAPHTQNDNGGLTIQIENFCADWIDYKKAFDRVHNE